MQSVCCLNCSGEGPSQDIGRYKDRTEDCENSEEGSDDEEDILVGIQNKSSWIFYVWREFVYISSTF